MGGIGEFEECGKEDRRIWEGEIWGRNMKNKNKKIKENKVKSRDRGIQKRRVTREIYSKVVIWVGW